jgi:hypothetical protein
MQVMNHFKNLACYMQVNKSSANYYLSDDTVIVADDRRSSVIKGGPAPPAGSGLKSETEEKRNNYMHC